MTKKTQEELQAILTEEQFYVTQSCGTEPAFSGAYWDCKESGTYRCICCQSPLFSSETKYDSGSGWPSFTDPKDKDAVAERIDTDYGMIRTEVTCSSCGAHLGHVFPDGPGPGGLRYCINSASLNLDTKD